MTYSDFTLGALHEQFGLIIETKELFPKVDLVPIPSWLQESLRRGREQALITEKARAEFLVTPILLACADSLGERFTLYSGVNLDVAQEQGLRGECDFILSRMPPIPEVRGPLVVIVEAKKGDVEAGIPQCAAQMLAARIFNERANMPVKSLHGCVTTGEDWKFLRLQDNRLAIEKRMYFLSELDQILSILVGMMKGNDSP